MSEQRVIGQNRVRKVTTNRMYAVIDHAAATRVQRWFHGIDSNRLKPIVLSDDHQAIETDKIYVMYHGTPSLENAALIEQNGINASRGGLLGPGIYVSRNIKKAEQYGVGGVIFEVLVKVGRVCHIQDHLIPVPVGKKLSGSSLQRMIAAKDLAPGKWNDAGYDTAWVSHDCPAHVFRGGAGWSEGHKEETCIFDTNRVTVLRRTVWDTDRADVNSIRWMFEEDENRVAKQGEAEGNFVFYSRRLSILIESHHLIYVEQAKRGRAQFIITIEGSRKIFHQHTGLQYEIDLERKIQKNVMTGYERCLQRTDFQNSRGGEVGGVSCGGGRRQDLSNMHEEISSGYVPLATGSSRLRAAAVAFLALLIAVVLLLQIFFQSEEKI